MMTKAHRINDMALGDLRPEKASVGGSIPSLPPLYKRLSDTKRFKFLRKNQIGLSETPSRLLRLVIFRLPRARRQTGVQLGM